MTKLLRGNAMKCINCGAPLTDHAKFCPHCGTPVDTEQTRLAEDDFRDHYNNYNAYENNGMPTDYPDRRFDESVTQNLPNNYGVPVYEDPYAAPPDRKPPMSNQKKALIISAIVLILVAAILGSVIFFVGRNNVSAAELDEAKQDFLPPAEATSIDASLDDPSNDDIRFKYDSRARILSCTYAVKEKTYDLSYRYNDAKSTVKIETEYRGHAIFTKDIEYDRVSEPNRFESVDGYYLRLDEKSLGASASEEKEEPAATEAPAPPAAAKKPVETQKTTEKPTEAPKSASKPKATEKPAEKKTAKPIEKPTEPPADPYKELYIDYLKNVSASYSSGTLVYLDGDDVPELVLFTISASKPTYVCYITDGRVKAFKTVACETFSYAPKSGYFTVGKMHNGIRTGAIYSFNGSGISEEHTMLIKDNKYQVDKKTMSEEEYDSFIDDFSFTDNIQTKSKDALPDYIRDF